MSCEKDISVDIPKPNQEYVVEGYIEENQFAYVFLTQNSAYFDEISLEKIVELTIKDAIVVVSNGSQSEQLEMVYDPNHFPYYKYVGKIIKGEKGKTYKLTIKIDQKVITSTTTIPNSVQIDSLKYKVEKNFPGDSLGYLWFYFTDPDTLGNYYKIYTKVLGKDSIFYQPFSSVSEDKIINGQFVEFSTYKGRNPLEPFKEGEYYKWFFKPNDTIVFKFTSIDASIYAFWYTLEMNSSSGGPFSSPITVKSNINGGLGVWGGYGVSMDTIIAKK
jgi:hypothetical protein